jgi:hypothetical protein
LAVLPPLDPRVSTVIFRTVRGSIVASVNGVLVVAAAQGLSPVLWGIAEGVLIALGHPIARYAWRVGWPGTWGLGKQNMAGLGRTGKGHPMVRITVLLGILCIPAFSQQAQGPLTNERIGGLMLAGVSQAEIIRIIGSAPAVNFDLRPSIPLETGLLIPSGKRRSRLVSTVCCAKSFGEATHR